CTLPGVGTLRRARLSVAVRLLRIAAEGAPLSGFFGYVGLAELAARNQEFACAYHWLRDAERLSQWRHVPEARFRGILPLINGVAWLHQGELRKARSALCQVLELYEGRGYLSPSGFYELLPRVRRYLA
ncbi:hypothetical protein, partial [Acinetobacter baumannii]|uniref:hypothetical protein n=1 Tax=Acinetobacter baumannii TaxID=470 RepID=UPI000B31AFA2